MFIGVQYYRPPFPIAKYWEDDLSRIKDTGIDAIQLWAVWGWIEPKLGEFKFDDYDSLINLAAKKGLKVVISTIAEIHPYWIHRIIPDSHMIDHMGNKVISSSRTEVNCGLTPGGCFDNPKVEELMGNFITQMGKRYGNESNLIGWDLWNELRWNVHSDGFVCYCPYTIQAFRDWLKVKYHDLEHLSAAWQRRYSSFEDVYPGKLPQRPFVEMMEFCKFLSDRMTKHMKFRYDKLKKESPTKIIIAHCAAPSVVWAGGGFEQPLNRGNDWDLSDQLDGFGCSHFPFWGEGFDISGFGTRVEAVRSAARGKTLWVSELQGGSARDGIVAHRSVVADMQQLWVWSGFSRGAKGVIFWCWKDEVFTTEASGFGIDGFDGFAKERLVEMKKTCELMKKYPDLLDKYMPDEPKIGILFEPDNLRLDWNAFGPDKDYTARDSTMGFMTACEKLNLPYEILESSHTDFLKNINLLILPWPLIIKETLKEKLVEFVKRGGLLLTEGELAAFDELGFYRYPGKERDFAYSIGVIDEGRRQIKNENFTAKINGKTFKLRSGLFFNPIKAEGKNIISRNANKDCVGIEKELGKGKIFSFGAFPAAKYFNNKYHDFEKLIYELAKESNSLPAVTIKAEKKGNISDLIYRSGVSLDKRLLFVCNAGLAKGINILYGKNTCRQKIPEKSWNVFILDKKITKLK